MPRLIDTATVIRIIGTDMASIDPGTACRFTVYHVIDVEALAPLFPVTIEDIA